MVLFGILWILNNREGKDRAIGLIKTMTEWHIWLLAVVYLFSCLSKLNRVSLLISELIACILVFILLKKRKFVRNDNQFGISINKMFQTLNIFFDSLLRERKIGELLYLLPWILGGIVLGISYTTVPYNYDSMTYHLPRIAHWAQNESVFPYATHINRQIGSTTMASYVCLYTYILAGKKTLYVNLIQGFSYCMDAYMVYAITKKLDLKKIYCVLASLLFMSLPIAFAEAMTTQNDLFSTMWLLFSIYIGLDFVGIEKKLAVDKQSMQKVFFLATSFSLGYISKPAVCFAMLILLVWILVCVLKRKDNVYVVLKMLFVGMITCIVVVLPTWLVNLSVWGKLSPSNVGAQQLIGTFDPRYVLLSLVKNSIYNLGNSVIPNFKNGIKIFLYDFAEILRVNLDDASISEFGGGFGYSSNPYGCDTALNPLIMVLFLGATVLLILTWRGQSILYRHYSVFTIVSYVTLCCCMRWEHFISRYMVGFFTLMCPMVMIFTQYIVDGMKQRAKQGIVFLTVLMLITGNWCLDLYYYYDDEPGTYFYYTWDMSHTYEKICDEIIDKGYKQIGLVCGGNSYEYPLWGILGDKGTECEIRHIMVDNELARYEDINYNPECVFVIDDTYSDIISYHGNEYIKTIEADNAQLLFLYERVK